jgi:hypothetical protein
VVARKHARDEDRTVARLSAPLPLFDRPRFDGETIEHGVDTPRLGKLLRAVYDLMGDGEWRTIREITDAIGAGSEASVSARLRDLRKPEFGAHTVDRRRRGEASRGLHEYRVRGQA